MSESTISSYDDGERLRNAFDHIHPEIDGYRLVMTPPLPPFLRGAFGRIYRGVNEDGVLMAIKVPHPHLHGSAALERWREECRLSLALPPHEHLVTFIGRAKARWPDGTEMPALVMEWLEGARGLIPYANALGLDKPQRVELFKQALHGVAWMHLHRTPHCDLKSSNLLVMERGGRPVVKVADFGGTRPGGRSDPRPPVFSPHRVAPEVRSGDPAAIDARADVYALGKELAELIGGEGAVARWTGDEAWTPAPLRQQLGLSDDALDEVIARATEVERGHRYPDANAMLTALAAYRPPGRERATRSLERWLWPVDRTQNRWKRPVQFLTGAAIACTLLGLFAIWWIVRQGYGPTPTFHLQSPPSLESVAIFRARTPEELPALAASLGIEGVNAAEPATNRRVWAHVVRELATLEPSVIVLDIAFPKHPNPALNEVIGGAIGEVRAKGIPVAIGVTDYQPGRADVHVGDYPTAPEVVAARAAWGCIRVEKIHGFDRVLVLPQGQDGAVRAPLAVLAMACHLGGKDPMSIVLDEARECLFLPPQAGAIDAGRRIALFGIVPRSWVAGDDLPGTLSTDLLGLYPIREPRADLVAPVDRSVADLFSPNAATRAAARELVRGRCVFLAAFDQRDVHAAADGSNVHGVWLQAAATEAMLRSIDSPTLRWFQILAALLTAPILLLLVLVIGVALLRRAGLAVPSLNGRWHRSQVQSWLGARRWSIAVLVSVVTIAAAFAGWLTLGTWLQWQWSYLLLTATVGAFAGVACGALLALGAAWMGLVRSAWCLERGDRLAPWVERAPS